MTAMQNRPRFGLLVFDFDGTLASSVEGITACMARALGTHGYAAPDADAVRATIGLTLEESVRRLTGGACPEEQVPEVVRTYRSLHLSEAAPRTTLFPGARAVLHGARRAGAATVLVSNKGSAGLHQLLEQLEIAPCFDLVLAADTVAHHKPSPALYDAHIAPVFAGVARRETLVVGDTESDLRFASGAGLASCWARYGYGDPAACRALGPDFSISELAELLEVLGVRQPAEA